MTFFFQTKSGPSSRGSSAHIWFDRDIFDVTCIFQRAKSTWACVTTVYWQLVEDLCLKSDRYIYVYIYVYIFRQACSWTGTFRRAMNVKRNGWIWDEQEIILEMRGVMSIYIYIYIYIYSQQKTKVQLSLLWSCSSKGRRRRERRDNNGREQPIPPWRGRRVTGTVPHRRRHFLKPSLLIQKDHHISWDILPRTSRFIATKSAGKRK